MNPYQAMADGHCRYVNEVLGARTWLVGGAVRDLLLGKMPKDWDFTTAMRPDDIEAAVRAAGRKPYTTGKKFGTIGFRSPNGQFYYEVTTFRTEGYDGKCRRPSEVKWVDNLSEDLSRRDFTINAMAYHPDDGIYDPFHGIEHTREGLVCCVGEPTIRFKEDALRMVRACRFSAQLDFCIDAWTYSRMLKNAHLLTNVSVERVVDEVGKILTSEYPRHGLRAMWETGLLRWFIPEMHLQWRYNQLSPYHEFQLHEHTIRVVEESINDIDVRWLAFLHDVSKPFCHTTKVQDGFGERQVYAMHDRHGKMMAKHICQYLKFSNARTDFVVGWIGRHQEEDCPIKEADDLGKGNV